MDEWMGWISGWMSVRTNERSTSVTRPPSLRLYILYVRRLTSAIAFVTGKFIFIVRASSGGWLYRAVDSGCFCLGPVIVLQRERAVRCALHHQPNWLQYHTHNSTLEKPNVVVDKFLAFYNPPSSHSDPPLVSHPCHINPTTSSCTVSSIMMQPIHSHNSTAMLQDQPPLFIQYIFISPPHPEANQLICRYFYAVQYNYCCHHLQSLLM